VKTYESIVKGEAITEPGIPESFKILIKELQSLGLQLSVESQEAEPVSLDGQEGEEVLA
jgi:DNA-directed RNA polymerase subunit beta